MTKKKKKESPPTPKAPSAHGIDYLQPRYIRSVQFSSRREKTMASASQKNAARRACFQSSTGSVSFVECRVFVLRVGLSHCTGSTRRLSGGQGCPSRGTASFCRSARPRTSSMSGQHLHVHRTCTAAAQPHPHPHPHPHDVARQPRQKSTRVRPHECMATHPPVVCAGDGFKTTLQRTIERIYPASY